MRRQAIALLCCVTAAFAQQVGQNASPQAPGYTFTTGAQLVVETVSVTDKNGRPVEGLKASDFLVTEDGARQAIKVFEYQSLPETPAKPIEKIDTANLHIYDKLSHAQIASEAVANGRYKDRRLVALYFDMSAMQPPDQLRALTAADKFIHTQMTAADMVAVLRYNGGAVEVLQDFTDDRARLLSIVQTMIVGEGQGLGESDASAPDTGAAFGQDDSEFNIFNTDRQLAALQTATQMLARLNEKKALVYFSSGLRLNGLNNQAQLRATVNSAIRAGVSFWTIDARGLVALPPLGDASMASPGNGGMYSGASAGAMQASFQRTQDTLYALASDTGGKALLDSNDLGRGITDAAHSVSSYYVIGYYTSNTAKDGRFRRIKIALEGEREGRLDYRQGYFAGKEFKKFTAADKERQLEDALMLPDPITELTIAMEIDYFQQNRAEYFVPIAVKIPGRELALAKRGGAERTVIDFIGEIKDAFGTTMSNVRDKVSIKLSDATAAELAHRPIVYDTGFTLLPGRYTIKFLARDDETGRIGTFQATFVVPNLNKDTKTVAISSVVLSSQRVELKDALYNVAKEKAIAASPLVQNGQKVIPSVTRVFRQGQQMFVYLQAYEQEAASTRPLMAYVTFYRGQEKVMQTQAIEARESAANRLKTMPLQFAIPLEGLAPGRYDCQVTVLDPEGERAAFWQAPVVIAP